tara:strand:- start:5825 stop:6043 length:219 start_codon:yes stop_codon:yes gene_type:complete
MKKFIQVYYPIILAFICLVYSVSLGILGDYYDSQDFTEQAQYTAHWPATILLFAIAIRQRRNVVNSKNNRNA